MAMMTHPPRRTLLASIAAIAAVACTPPDGWLPNPNGSQHEQAGFAVAIDSNWAMSGVMRSDTIFGSAGKVLVYRRVNHNWSLVQSLVSGDPQTEGNFGWSVDLSGDRAIVGAPFEQEAYALGGAAYVFERSGNSWTQKAQFFGDTTESGFANSAAISGDYAVVGAPFPAPPTFVGAGVAFVYRRDSLGAWLRDTTLHASDAIPNILFGWSVAIDDDVIVVGARQGVVHSTIIGGAAYVFRRSGTVWIQEAKLRAVDPDYHDFFGTSVSVSGDTVIVGANGDNEKGNDAGAAYVFERDSLGMWQHLSKFQPATAGDEFGSAVSIDGRWAIVGASLAGANDSYKGAAWMYYRDNTSWVAASMLAPHDLAYGDRFGYSVSISGPCAVVGAPARNIQSTDGVGATYIYCDTVPGLSDFHFDIICCWQPPSATPQPVVATIQYRNGGTAQRIGRRRIELVTPNGRVTETVGARTIMLGPGESMSERVVLQIEPPLERGRHEVRLRWSDDTSERIERAYFVPPATNQAALGSRR